jgi:hypothetical protein
MIFFVGLSLLAIGDDQYPLRMILRDHAKDAQYHTA